MSVVRTERGKDVRVFAHDLPRSARTDSSRCPATVRFADASETSFILEDQANTLEEGVALVHCVPDALREFFLNSF